MIRPSTRDDIPSIMTLSRDSGLFLPEHLEILREMLIDFFDTPGEQERFWLTDEDAGSVGIVFCEPEIMTLGTWNLRLIAVAPMLQGTGRGGLLLAHVENHLRQKHARLLIVDTSGKDEFAPVRQFYSKYGYFEESRIRGFFDDGDDKVTYTKILYSEAQQEICEMVSTVPAPSTLKASQTA